MSDDYINRHLYCGEALISDGSILDETGIVVVASEPGAGKTELLNYLARESGARAIAATVFRNSTAPIDSTLLIVDGLDEVARIDNSGTDAILVKACEANTRTVVLATRSYVWDESRSKLVRDTCGREPKLLRLQSFDRQEQQRLFHSYLPGEDFESFLTETDRFELTPLLGNPQFLQMFADAYVESGRHFTTKRQIYVDAVKRLTRERKNASNQLGRPPAETLIEVASEMYAKLLLSGGVGVTTAESAGDDSYPFVRSLTKVDTQIASAVLDTRLFKPADDSGKHEPVHRIIAEYCAAQYLARRIEDASDRLSLGRCLAVIAPNGAVRDELRGMLGWMATLGAAQTQERIVDLDPYAVFANGDPSQLTATSKQRLLNKLKELADIDPYFRRVDMWRRFSAAGFFTEDVVDALRTQIESIDHVSHLQGLLLELMKGSSVVASLIPEIRGLLLAPNAPKETRALAYECLADIDDHDHLSDFDALVSEGSAESLRIAAEMVQAKGSAHFGAPRIIALLLGCSDLYPEPGARERTIGSRYFIRKLVKTFSIEETCDYLDQLTADIACVCGATKTWRCNCRAGKSKVAGLMVDNYFERVTGSPDPAQVWRWTRPLVFPLGNSTEKSPAVAVLSADGDLRQAIHRLAFADATSLDEIHEVASHFFAGHGHAGLRMKPDDIRAIVDHAFETGNLPLWQSYYHAHSIYSPKHPNPLRAHMKAQAQASAPFLHVWARQERHYRTQARKDRRDKPYSARRYERQEAEVKGSRHAGFQRDIAMIEAGQHWGWLQEFANAYLDQHGEIEETQGDPAIIERSLRSCLPFLAPHSPTLRDLSEHKGSMIAHVQHAACLAIFREEGTLRGIDIKVLKAVKTDGASYSGYREGEQDRFESEIDRLIFPSAEDRIAFAREFIEPQFEQKQEAAVQLGLFTRDAAFEEIRPGLSMEWLDRFPAMPFEALRQLFDLCAAEGERQELVALIERRCGEPLRLSGNAEEDKLMKQRRQFWLLRHFFFISPTSDAVWEEFSADDTSIFSVEQKAGRFRSGETKGWPQLGAEKIYRVLKRYIPVWPKVFLPSSFGTSDPDGVRAYRFLSEIIWQMGRDDPAFAIPVLNELLADDAFKNHWDDAKSIKAASVRKRALADFVPPGPVAVNGLLDNGSLATVEDLRALLVELLAELQVWLKGAATTPLNIFYVEKRHVDENTVRDRLVEMLQHRLNALNLQVNVEQRMANENRCDITVSAVIDGKPVLLVIEAKGQWHKALFTAASAQLAERYSIHPGAAQQGLYLVFWFGAGEKVAGVEDTTITSPNQLQVAIEEKIPETLRTLIDVVVLDLSHPAKQAAVKSGDKKAKGGKKRKAAADVSVVA